MVSEVKVFVSSDKDWRVNAVQRNWIVYCRKMCSFSEKPQLIITLMSKTPSDLVIWIFHLFFHQVCTEVITYLWVFSRHADLYPENERALVRWKLQQIQLHQAGEHSVANEAFKLFSIPLLTPPRVVKNGLQIPPSNPQSLSYDICPMDFCACWNSGCMDALSFLYSAEWARRKRHCRLFLGEKTQK